MKFEKEVCLFEIFILIMVGVAFSYFIHESSDLATNGKGESPGITWLREKVLGYLSNGLVSAQEEILWTCPEDKNGSICQEYPSDVCDDKCLDGCIPTRRSETSECVLGTCIDPTEGTCSANSPRLACENSGGGWYDEVPTQCTPGCCLLGGNSNFITENSCNVLSDRLGIPGEFQEVESEIQCLLLGEQQEEGACLLDEVLGEGFNCKFTTKAECLSMDGEFNLNQLCTNPALETVCEKTEETTCVSGKDQVYYKDSCGNIANIYDYDKKVDDSYWSELIQRNESCSLDGNQAGCGSCSYLDGSVCGEYLEEGDDEKPLLGDYVCRDLSCVDEFGDERKNGESWCAFDGRIGPTEWPKSDDEKGKVKNNRRSTDLPGSRHYRQVCLDGEVRTDPCQDFRNEICVENRDEEIGFSSSACRLNAWQLCLDANTDKDKLNRCEENADCFLKEVRIADQFKFDVCVPKYPGGLDLKAEQGGEVGEGICGLATQKCKVIKVKGLTGDTWVNKKCLDNKFTEGMNNLCTSLGDCGGDVNIEGVYTSSGFSVKGGGKKKLNDAYISVLKTYADRETWRGQTAEPLSDEELAALFGMTKAEWEASDHGLGMLGQISGGLGMAFAAYGAPLLAGLGVDAVAGGAWLVPGVGEGAGPGLGPYGGAAVGAMIGAAITSYLINMLGIGKGLPSGVIYAMVGLGAFAGAVAGFSVLGNVSVLFAFLGWIAFAALVIMLIVFSLMGIGSTDEWNVTYTCRPWQPPIGGDDCGKCTEGDLPCSEYKCQSLGQTCDFVNEGTGEEECINTSPNDATSPVISPNYDVVEEPFEYSEEQKDGFKVIHNELECIPAYTLVQFGVSLDEHGQCKYDSNRGVEFEDMEFWFGGRSLFKEDHTMALMMPSLESLGVYGVDPGRRADFDMYVKCRDGSGNVNAADYDIQLCVSPEDDLTPPILKLFNPVNPGYAKMNATEKDVSFYTNEPAECKWDSKDIAYDTMVNNVYCANNITDMTLFGWACNSTLPVDNDANEYYFRCKDQPWNEDETERNTNQESVFYNITRTVNPLLIDVIRTEPEIVNGKIIYGTIKTEVKLIVETSGGAPGRTVCRYNLGGLLDYDFKKTYENPHTNIFNQLIEGDYHWKILCEDSAGNLAEDEISFEMKIDDAGPRITRVYYLNDRLNVVTDEKSECSYTHLSCNFGLDDEGVIKMSGRDLLHTADFDKTLNYYLKCKDGFDNTGQCLTVRPGY